MKVNEILKKAVLVAPTCSGSLLVTAGGFCYVTTSYQSVLRHLRVRSTPLEKCSMPEVVKKWEDGKWHRTNMSYQTINKIVYERIEIH